MKINFTKLVTVFFLAGLFALTINAHGQIITTYAGNETQGYSGDGGQATAAQLYDVVGVAIDDTGNIYIADSHNHAIRKVEASTGIITTIAGTGTGGYNGDGIAATSAQINDPQQISLDDSGNIYFADYGNEAIREIKASTGIITTIAGTPTVWSFSGDGGPATAAKLSVVTGVAVDDSGNVFIADQWNHRVRKVTKATGIINTIIGSGSYGFNGNGIPATSASLAYPTEIALDDSGNIYFTDAFNNEVRKVTRATGLINDFAGDQTVSTGLGSGAYSGDGGPATASQLNYPNGLFRDDSGNVYIGDWYNQVIRKVTASTGNIITIAGDGFGKGSSNGVYSGDGGAATAAELNAPEGLAVDMCGNIYIGDMFNNSVRKVTVASDSLKVTPLTSSICNGTTDTLKASGGSGYTWSPSAGLSDTTGSIVIANPTITTTYTLTGNAGCGGSVSTSLSVIVTVTSSPVVTITPVSPVVCNGQSITLKASGGAAYQWVGTSNTTDSLLINPVKDTTYELIVSNGTCSKDTLITVKAGNPPPLDIEPQSPVICNGSVVTLYVNGGGANFTWSPGTGLSATSGDSVIANPTADVTYTVTGTDSIGCSATGTDNVSVVPSPNKPTITVSGDSLISSATQGNQWYYNDTLINGATNQVLIVSGNKTGTYTVTVINPANGCSATSDATSGINQLSMIGNQLSIFPNPTTGIIFINISSSVNNLEDWKLEVSDVLGRRLFTMVSLNHSNEIDISNLSSGIYFMTVTNKTGRAVFPIVKQN